jgi:branched-chain amino acid transport system permease protein
VLSALVDGVTVGALYALLALGPSLVYGLLRVLDIANAAALTLGAYLAVALYQHGIAWWIGALVGMAGAVVLGLLLQWLLYRPLLGQGPLVVLVASIGVFIALGEAFRLIFGPYAQHLPVTVPLPSGTVAGTPVTGVQVLMLIIGVVVLAGSWFVLTHTRIGFTWRATAQDRETARAMGINVNRVIARIFAVGYALAALAGVLYAIRYNSVTPDMGDVPAYKMLAIIVLGGLGNPMGTVLAAFVIGLAEAFVAAYAGFVLPKDTIAFLVLIAILLIRPAGLLPKGLTKA